MNQQPDDQPTDLDVVDDIGGTDADRAFDAQLSSRLRASPASSGGTASVHDLTALKERGRQRRRRRTRLQRAAAVATAAAVVVSATAVVLHERRSAPLLPAAGTSLPLLPDLPALSTDDELRLRALQPPDQPLVRGYNASYWEGTFDRWAVPVDCAEAAAWSGLQVPTLPGLDTRGYTQVCATDDEQALTDGSFSVSPSGGRPALFRFYLPPSTDLGRVTPGDAAAAGVSWTRIIPTQRQPAVTLEQSPDALAAGSTHVTRTSGDLAVVAPDARGGTVISWYEWAGDASFAASATIAADPVTAVRATLDPHPCEGSFNLTPVGSFGEALTARGALQTWLEGDDAADFPEGAGSQGAPSGDWVVVEEHGNDKTFASGDWRVRVNGHLPGTWMVTGKSCDATG